MDINQIEEADVISLLTWSHCVTIRLLSFPKNHELSCVHPRSVLVPTSHCLLLPTYLPVCLSVCLPACLACLPAYPPTYL